MSEPQIPRRPDAECFVRVLRTVRGDGPWCWMCVDPGVYPARMNRNGAVSVEVTHGLRGQFLGLKPDEFEFVPPPQPPVD